MGPCTTSAWIWRHLPELHAATRPLYGEQKNLIVWSKTNPAQGSLYRSQHELIALYKVGTASHTNNVELGRHGRNRSNVWTYSGVNTFKGAGDLALHPTVKPVALVVDAIKDVTRRGAIVLDPFSRQRYDLAGCGEDGTRGAGARTRPGLCRCRYPALAGLHGTGRHSRRYGRDLGRGPVGSYGPCPARGGCVMADATNSAMIKPKRRTGYEVGYGKPPADHRFRKGHSGNPRGRPRGKSVPLGRRDLLDAFTQAAA